MHNLQWNSTVWMSLFFMLNHNSSLLQNQYWEYLYFSFFFFFFLDIQPYIFQPNFFYFMLKKQKNLLQGGIFGLSRQFFQVRLIWLHPQHESPIWLRTKDCPWKQKDCPWKQVPPHHHLKLFCEKILTGPVWFFNFFFFFLIFGDLVSQESSYFAHTCNPMANFTAEKCSVWKISMKMCLV